MRFDIKEYFSFKETDYLEGKVIYKYLTEVSILEAEEMLLKENIDISNIYFKLLAQVQFLEQDAKKNQNEIAYLYYLIGYYLGLFLHPFEGDRLALNALEKAIKLEKDQKRIQMYKETIMMIKEEL